MNRAAARMACQPHCGLRAAHAKLSWRVTGQEIGRPFASSRGRTPERHRFKVKTSKFCFLPSKKLSRDGGLIARLALMSRSGRYGHDRPGNPEKCRTVSALRAGFRNGSFRRWRNSGAGTAESDARAVSKFLTICFAGPASRSAACTAKPAAKYFSAG